MTTPPRRLARGFTVEYRSGDGRWVHCGHDHTWRGAATIARRWQAGGYRTRLLQNGNPIGGTR